MRTRFLPKNTSSDLGILVPNILNSLPFFTKPNDATGKRLCLLVPGLAGESHLKVRPYQIVVWVGISPKDAASPLIMLPAILDTGHNQNFSVRHECLSGITLDSQDFPRAGWIRPAAGGDVVPYFSADLWLYCNLRGERDTFRGRPVRLAMKKGVIAYPPGRSDGPRVPLLGLRDLVDNNLTLRIDGRYNRVHIRQRSWYGW